MFLDKWATSKFSVSGVIQQKKKYFLNCIFLLHFAEIFNYENGKNLSHYRCTIDYPEDLILLRELAKRIKNRPILLKDIIMEYQKDPKLTDLLLIIFQN